jgi:hypothetical protein
MIGFSKGSRRNTPCYVMRVGEATCYISYETVIAVNGYDDKGEWVRLRRRNVWGPTTGRHMSDMGVREYPELDDEDEFNRVVEELVTSQLLKRLTDRLAA